MSNTVQPPWRVPSSAGHEPRHSRAETPAAEHGPFPALVAQSEILAANGRFAEARALLLSSRGDLPIATIDRGSFSSLVATAILSQAADLASRWLSERFNASYEISIGRFRSAARPGVTIFQVRGNTARFLFGHCMFEPRVQENQLHRWVAIFPLFDAFMNSSERIDGQVNVNLADIGRRFGVAFCDYRPEYFLIPDATYMDTERYAATRRYFQSNDIPWNDRLPVAFWRGATTGNPTDPAIGWRGLPRIRLCEICAADPDLFDAGITDAIQPAGLAARDWLQSAGMMRPHVPFHAFQRYRYQIDIDGNTNSWPGLFQKLLTGSPVLKVASYRGLRQWYYDRLKPWINFVPVEADMADLADKVRWLRDHDDVARKIGGAGRALANALADPREVAKTPAIIAAAMRAAGKAPLIDLRFTEGAPDNAAVGDGWQTPAPGGLNPNGFEGRLELPIPQAMDDFILIADVSPRGEPPQRMTVIANGRVLAQRTVMEPTTLYWPLPRSAVLAGATLSLNFCFPDGKLAASRARPLDDRILSIALQRVRVAVAHTFTGHEHPDIATALAELNAGRPPMLVHDLSAPGRQVLPAEPRYAVYTTHGTVLYADLEAGRVRHRDEATAPRNLFLVHESGAANLVRARSDGELVFVVRLRPEGMRATQAETASDADGYVETFEMIMIGGAERDGFGLFGSGLFACAEPNGDLTLSRGHLGEWERFSVRPRET